MKGKGSCFFGCFGKCNRDVETSGNKSSRLTVDSGNTISLGTKTLVHGRLAKRFRWDEIEKMTGNFSEVIAEGGFTTVYLARFSDSNSWAAVKVYNCGYSERLNREFRTELDICSELNHHPNIVKLLGYCDERADEGVLVFEYIPHGNLQQLLHDNKTASWKTRMTIAYQLANVLDHLHEQSTPHIIHGDIKPSNILLLLPPVQHHNNNKTTTSSSSILNCKLCDFGSAKKGFASTIINPNSSSSSRSTAMMGSPGYIDPHYLMTGLVSKKSDIYSLGVVILELITGIEAYCSETEQLLTTRVRTRNKDKKEYFDVKKVVGMVDARVKDEAEIDEVKTMACIAAMCVHHLPSLRPSAAEVCRGMRERIDSISEHEFTAYSTLKKQSTCRSS